MIKFTLYTQHPKPKKIGTGVLSIYQSQIAMFFSENADKDSKVIAELDNVRIVHASSDSILLEGKEPMGTNKEGSLIFKYQEWLLKSPEI